MPLPSDVIAAQLKPIHPKTVVMVFDVTGSTKYGGVFSREREAAATILRKGCDIGDHVVLLKFGTGYSAVIDTIIHDPADAIQLVDKIPPSVEPGHGTNIRWPHAEALKIVQQGLPNPGRIILMTDSFNDGPDASDPNMVHYNDYYSSGGLTKYPKTAANKRYETLLRVLKKSGKLKQYGVGVSIARSGRPIERLPVAPGESDDNADSSSQIPTSVPNAEDTRSSSRLPWIAAVGGLTAAAIILWFVLSRRPMPVRLSVGTKGFPTDFRVRPGERIAIGGPSTGTIDGAQVLPLSGVLNPVAWLRAERSGIVITPAAGPIVPSSDHIERGECEITRVFHNGIRLAQTSPVKVDDEIRVAVPAGTQSAEREYRVRVLDPSGPLF